MKILLSLLLMIPFMSSAKWSCMGNGTCTYNSPNYFTYQKQCKEKHPDGGTPKASAIRKQALDKHTGKIFVFDSRHPMWKSYQDALKEERAFNDKQRFARHKCENALVQAEIDKNPKPEQLQGKMSRGGHTGEYQFIKPRKGEQSCLTLGGPPTPECLAQRNASAGGSNPPPTAPPEEDGLVVGGTAKASGGTRAPASTGGGMCDPETRARINKKYEDTASVLLELFNIKKEISGCK